MEEEVENIQSGRKRQKTDATSSESTRYSFDQREENVFKLDNELKELKEPLEFGATQSIELIDTESAIKDCLSLIDATLLPNLTQLIENFYISQSIIYERNWKIGKRSHGLIMRTFFTVSTAIKSGAFSHLATTSNLVLTKATNLETTLDSIKPVITEIRDFNLSMSKLHYTSEYSKNIEMNTITTYTDNLMKTTVEINKRLQDLESKIEEMAVIQQELLRRSINLTSIQQPDEAWTPHPLSYQTKGWEGNLLERITPKEKRDTGEKSRQEDFEDKEKTSKQTENFPTNISVERPCDELVTGDENTEAKHLIHKMSDSSPKCVKVSLLDEIMIYPELKLRSLIKESLTEIVDEDFRSLHHLDDIIEKPLIYLDQSSGGYFKVGKIENEAGEQIRKVVMSLIMYHYEEIEYLFKIPVLKEDFESTKPLTSCLFSHFNESNSMEEKIIQRILLGMNNKLLECYKSGQISKLDILNMIHQTIHTIVVNQEYPVSLFLSHLMSTTHGAEYPNNLTTISSYKGDYLSHPDDLFKTLGNKKYKSNLENGKSYIDSIILSLRQHTFKTELYGTTLISIFSAHHQKVSQLLSSDINFSDLLMNDLITTTSKLCDIMLVKTKVECYLVLKIVSRVLDLKKLVNNICSGNLSLSSALKVINKGIKDYNEEQGHITLNSLTKEKVSRSN